MVRFANHEMQEIHENQVRYLRNAGNARNSAKPSKIGYAKPRFDENTDSCLVFDANTRNAENSAKPAENGYEYANAAQVKLDEREPSWNSLNWTKEKPSWEN